MNQSPRIHVSRRRLRWPGLAICGLIAAVGCGTSSPPGAPSDPAAAGSTSDPSGSDRQILRLPMRTDGPKSLDPAQGSTKYDNICCSQVYEQLLQFKYLVRPFELEPLLLEQMPSVSEDGLTYRFLLKDNVYFQDDPCFPDGKGRKLVSADVFYSLKRLLDTDVSQRSAWVIRDKIQGLDDYADAQNDANNFDYDHPVDGMRALSDREFEIELTEPVTSFLWTLAMFQTSIVPREAVEKYEIRFGRHPVGTGPYCMDEKDWINGKSMRFTRNQNYHECYYPTEHMPEDVEKGFQEDAGKRLPLNDGIEYRFFVEDQPMWLQFRSDHLDYTGVPRDNFADAFNLRTRKLRPEFKKLGITSTAVPLLDFIFFGFNMEDELLGGYTDEKRYLRQAISLAMDWEERNDSFYNNICRIYDGMIPPGLAGYPPDGKSPAASRGPDLQRARELLAKAGYPEGKGLPRIDYYSSLGGNSKEMAELTRRQLQQIGIDINPRLDVFSTFIESVNNKKAQFFSFAWGSDYPDAENNLALFYGPNESPGSNHFNYKNPEYDKLYEKIRSMPPSPERTAIYEEMRDMVLRDVPFLGSMARTRYYLGQPWLKNFKPSDTSSNWPKYLRVDR